MRALPALAKISFAAFLLSAIVGLVAAIGTRLGFWSQDFGLSTLLPWCLGIDAVALVLGAVWVVWAIIANDSTSARYGLVGVVGAGIILFNPVMEYWNARGLPSISDVTTDTENPPPFVSLLTQRGKHATAPGYDGSAKVTWEGKTTTVSLLQHKYYGDIHSVAILMSPERLFRRAVAAAYKMGWNVVAIAPDEGRIEATDTSFFFGIKDDIVIRVKPAGMGAKLDMRSKARVAGDDEDRNMWRVRNYFQKLSEVP
jgi:hypothetical protein